MVNSAPPTILMFGAFEVRPQTCELRKHGIRMKLPDREFQVLLALLEKPGQIVTRGELQQRLWSRDSFVEFDNGLNNAVSRLRSALGDSSETPQHIETVPRRGYRFVAPVSRQSAATPRPSAFRRWSFRAAVFILALALVGIVFRSLANRGFRVRSLAVLPFSSSSSSATGNQGYLGSSMTDAVLLNLSKIASLRLVPGQTALEYAHSNESLAQIAHDLHVDAIANGSVLPENNELQVNVQLDRGTDGAQLWTGSFDEQPSDFLRLSRDVTRGIVDAAKLDLTPREEEALDAQASVNPQAYEDFLKGRYYMNQMTEGSRTEALSYFEQAVAVAPGFAPGYEGLANYYELTDALPPSVAMPKAETYASKALKIDSMLPSAHVALAVAYFYGDWNWAASDREFRRALQLDPGLPSAHVMYADLLSCTGHFQDALNQLQQARELDPLYLPAYDAAASIWLFAHQYDQSALQATQLLSLSPSGATGLRDLGTAYLFQGKYSEAIREFENVPSGNSGHDSLQSLLLGLAYARAGDRASAFQQMGALKRLSARQYVPPFLIACLYASLGANQNALDELDQAYRQRDTYMVFLKVMPYLDSLRQDPRFQQLTRKMNFPR